MLLFLSAYILIENLISAILIGDGCSGQFSINNRCPREKKQYRIYVFWEGKEKDTLCIDVNVQSVFTN